MKVRKSVEFHYLVFIPGSWMGDYPTSYITLLTDCMIFCCCLFWGQLTDLKDSILGFRRFLQPAVLVSNFNINKKLHSSHFKCNLLYDSWHF